MRWFSDIVLCICLLSHQSRAPAHCVHAPRRQKRRAWLQISSFPSGCTYSKHHRTHEHEPVATLGSYARFTANGSQQVSLNISRSVRADAALLVCLSGFSYVCQRG
ncbi:hypothetical protein F5B21DRAFT_463219 [Xylaria acuta]|nr:hypothetical protein F5B21DRAFT_463219 [Xylaria acuta]